MNALRRLLVGLAGLYGAAGVALSAAAAHMAVDASLATAAQFLLFGALSLLGITAFAVAGGPGWSFAEVGGAMIALGTALFSGAIAMRILVGLVLFPMAAPTGGTLTIAGWLVVALAAFERRARPT
ncbi:DUF423 domain-containing protein [Ancylobacter sp. 6x-1]|uniref:DUF423 domain-containing protein n=1 Tax=Ancylobacter crimeensis TaxID=2579147 RepID=A0ABT0D9F3_9HYPH|nr:DUF423 domain-containing protein [Ancylobacter crimeensis]MCK0196582.1 DUF423 domain-containing protein [Ancylobacter crimeensis]